MASNVAGMLTYVLGFITGVIFLGNSADLDHGLIVLLTMLHGPA